MTIGSPLPPEVNLAILIERIERIETATRLQAIEYERRLEQLNHEAVRVAKAQAVSVTAEKFDDYTRTQQRALELALATIQDKFATRADGNQSASVALGDRVSRLETDVRADRAAADVLSARRARDSDHRVTWMVGVMGLVVAVVVVIANVIINRTP